MPLQATSGAASYDAFGGGVPVVPNYIEDVFSTWLRVSDGTNTQSVVNNIDLSTKGGLVWSKPRAAAGENHIWVDSARGVNKYLSSDLTGAQGTMTYPYTFNTNGYTVGNGNFWANGVSLVDWTFRKQPKFFDVVTYSGNDTGQAISHNLGSVPGCIIVKSTTGVSNWVVYHRSLGSSQFIQLSTTGAAISSTAVWGGVDPTSTQFTVGTSGGSNASGNTYVAYLFAHNAGGFGLTGTDNVISCGSFTTDGSSNATITLGYEPQWVLTKRTDSSGAWGIYDTMRGWSYSAQNYLLPNDSGAEGTINSTNFKPTATGFTIGSPYDSSATYIYIAIRRGPMKVPTSGTSVFAPVTQAGGGFDTAGFPVDLLVLQGRNSATGATWTDRLRGSSKYFNSSSTAAESSTTGVFAFDNQTGVQDNFFGSGTSVAYWNFRRAPSTFDEVCYTGNATSGSTQTHNLGVAPEFMIVKGRSVNANWFVYSQALGATKYLVLNDTGGSGTLSSVWNDTSPTSTQFTLGNAGAVNASGGTYVAYLWATNAGVTKVGSYTGNGSSQTINCGFTGGSRLVLIIRTDASGDRYIWDSARGIVSGNDPHLSLNSTAAEVTTDDTIDTDSTGFIVNQVSATNCNVSGANYIFLSYA